MNGWSMSGEILATATWLHHIHFCLVSPQPTAETTALGHFCILCALSSNKHADQDGLRAGLVRDWEGW